MTIVFNPFWLCVWSLACSILGIWLFRKAQLFCKKYFN